MVPYGDFSSVLLLSSQRNYVLCPDKFKRMGPLDILILEKVQANVEIIIPNPVVFQSSPLLPLSIQRKSYQTEQNKLSYTTTTIDLKTRFSLI